MDHGLISVIIPMYNAELYIKECINSILEQTYKNYEIIIVDDGSKDKSAEIVSKYNNKKIKLFTQENSGAASARNSAVNYASGKWIAFIDSDDTWFPDKLQKQMEKCYQSDWSHTDSYFMGNVYEEGTKASDFTKKFSGNVLPELVVENFVGTSSVIIKKDVFLEFGGFNPKLKALEDWDLWLKVASKYSLCYANDTLINYRIHSDSISRSAKRNLSAHIDLINRVFNKGGIGESLKNLKQDSLFRSYIISSYISEQENDYLFSIYCTFHCLIRKPLNYSLYSRVIKLVIKKILFHFKSGPGK